jgi:copper chaperone CopZ
MTHTYKVAGMTCEGCKAKVKHLLSNTQGVKEVNIDLTKGEAAVTMDSHIATSVLQNALKDYPKYKLTEKASPVAHHPSASMNDERETKSWVATYKPILLIFGYITTVSLIAASTSNGLNIMLAMRLFMSGFFLVFSFFKLLDLNAFADSYSMYDIVAKKIKGWGYLYAFIELGLGLAFALNVKPVLVNSITLIVMSISIIGVLQSVLNKRKIQCACLGAVFNLPMSTVTIIEDALMIGMSALMLMWMN